jgi:hypothetical protein
MMDTKIPPAFTGLHPHRHRPLLAIINRSVHHPHGRANANSQLQQLRKCPEEQAAYLNDVCVTTASAIGDDVAPETGELPATAAPGAADTPAPTVNNNYYYAN